LLKRNARPPWRRRRRRRRRRRQEAWNKRGEKDGALAAPALSGPED
jgi:hypothetical protein